MRRMREPAKTRTVKQIAKRSIAVTVELFHHEGKSLQLNPLA